jgi:hypothetical protein
LASIAAITETLPPSDTLFNSQTQIEKDMDTHQFANLESIAEVAGTVMTIAVVTIAVKKKKQ